MTEVAGRDFTAEEAREFVERVRTSVEDIKDWIVRAVKGRAWIALGYPSWDAMCEAEFDGAVIRLPREDRREAVASLREAGLSTRAIGSALGVSHQSVQRDLSTGPNGPVEPESVTSLDGRHRPASQPPRPQPEPESVEPDGDHDDEEGWVCDGCGGAKCGEGDPAHERCVPGLLTDLDEWHVAHDDPAEDGPDRGEPRQDPPDELEAEPLPQPALRPAPKPAPVMLTLLTHTGESVPYPQPQGKATFNLSEGDGISWAKWSWNPVTGCLHGCDYCYARAIAARFPDAYPVGFTPLFHHERLDAPANTVIPAARRDDPAYERVFVCSMADLYGRWVPDDWIAAVHESMLASPEWQYITLTKFPARYVGLDMPPGAWVGTSVDEQKRVRIAEDAFRKIDGVAVKWLSLEPLREPLEFTDLSMFDWVVIGAQTETRQPDGTIPAFDPDPRWVMRITDQAKEAGCRVHWKPNLRHVMWFDEYPSSEGGAA